MKTVANTLLVYFFEIELSELNKDNSKELQFWGGLLLGSITTVMLVCLWALLQY